MDTGDKGDWVPPIFDAKASGWSASLNSLVFFTCRSCGACVIEIDATETSRTLHAEWHQRIAGGGCSNYTARSWLPTSPEPEDNRCVNCGRPEAEHSGGPSHPPETP